MVRKSSAPVSLISALSTALRELERAYILERDQFDGIPTIDEWANLLRVLGSTPTDNPKLPAMVRLSKRAVRSRVLSALRKGWIQEAKLGPGVMTVRLTERGCKVANSWNSLQARAEERWRSEIGIERFDTLLRSLGGCVSLLPFEYPHYPASYGAADASITGGNGVDWTGVPRTNRASVLGLPMLALLSQALVAFAMSYEDRSPVALSLSSAVIRLIPPEGCSRKGLGHSVGISALMRHGFLRSDINRGNEFLYLTPSGASVQELYDQRISAVEAEWRLLFGDDTFVELELAVKSIVRALSHLRQAQKGTAHPTGERATLSAEFPTTS